MCIRDRSWIGEHRAATDIEGHRNRQHVEVPRPEAGPFVPVARRPGPQLLRAVAERALEVGQIAALGEHLVVLVDDAERHREMSGDRAKIPRVTWHALTGALVDRALERGQHRTVERTQRYRELGYEIVKGRERLAHRLG